MPRRKRQSKSRRARTHEAPAEKTVILDRATYAPWQIAAVCLALAAVTVIAFWGVRANDFLSYDDDHYVLENRNVQQGVTTERIRWAFTTFYGANWHPLTWISHMADWSWYGKNPGGHHLTCVFLHAANAVLLFLLLLYMTGFLWRAAMVAFLFALHPAHVESVAWIAERKDVLCALFWFATLLAYAWYVRRPSWRRLAWVAAGFACGLMSKPMAVTLPFTLLLLDYWPLRRIEFTRETRPQWLSSCWELCVEKWPLFLMAAVSSIITVIAQKAGGAVAQLQNVPLGARICNAVISYCRYALLMLWPDPLRVFYFHERENIMVSSAVLSAVALFLVSAVCWRFREKRPYCLSGWLWFLGTLVPVIGLVQVGDQAMAERYTYVPYIGLFVAVVWLAGDIVVEFPKLRTATQLLAVAVVVACAVKTEAQVKLWKDTATLFRHVLEIDSRGAIPNTSLGVAYARLGRHAEASEYLKRALEYSPNDYEAHNNLGTNLGELGLKQEALKEFRISLAIKPDQVAAHSKIGRILAETNQLPEAVEEYNQALRLDPDDAYAHNDLGVVLFQMGDYERAAEQFSDAIRIAPAYTDARRNLDLARGSMKNRKG